MLPLLASTLCLLSISRLYEEGTGIATRVRTLLRQSRMAENAFADVINRGYKKLSPCFSQEKPAHPLADKPPQNPALNQIAEPELRKLATACHDLELKVDRVAKQLMKAEFHSNSDRLKSYLGLIKETIEQASKTETYLQTNNEAAVALWQEWENLRAITYGATLFSVLLSLTLAVLICAYFSRTIMQRIATLSSQAWQIFPGPSSKKVSSTQGRTDDDVDDEFSVIEAAFQQLRRKLAGTEQERVMLTKIITSAVHEPTAKALKVAEHLKQGEAYRSNSTVYSKWTGVIELAAHKIESFLRDLETINASLADAQDAIEEADLSYFSAREKCQKILTELAPLAQKRNLTLKNECADSFIMSAPESFERITSNLVSNAIKFAPPGTQIRLTSSDDEDNLKISVIDQGQGLSKSDEALIFQEHYQGDSRQKQEGFGLGLSICQRLVQNLGGRIGYSRKGGETQFWFTLPRALLSSAPGQEQEESSRHGSREPQKQSAQSKLSTGSAFSSPMFRKMLLLLVLPLVTQALALGWIYTNMEAASQVLAKIKRQQEITSGTSRIWLNAFNGGYSAALYLALQDGRYEGRAKECVQKIRTLAKAEAPGALDEAEDVYILKALQAAADNESSRIEKSLDVMGALESEDFIGSFAHSLKRGELLSAKMSNVLEHQFARLSTLLEAEAEKQKLVKDSLLIILLFNLTMATLIPFLYAKILSKRVVELAHTSLLLAEKNTVEHPQKITDELDQLKEELALAFDGLKEAERSREQLMNSLAHDIRAPMQSIQIALETLAKLEPQTDARGAGRLEASKLFRQATAGIYEGSELINDLLTLNKLKTAPQKALSGTAAAQELEESAPINWQELLYEAVANQADRSGARDIGLELEDCSGGSLRPAGQVDRDLFLQMLECAIKVAVDNAPAQTQVTIKLNHKRGLSISIKDEGPPLGAQYNLPIKLTRPREPGRLKVLLALAILEQLAKANQMRLSLSSQGTSEITLSES
ncbi:MAG: ATP-binding protein [Candidatus Obscuribacter sp.]|nr:ATP-binding protein [Candidatus Obscuribacter sp.]